jgi:hypothetical protein
MDGPDIGEPEEVSSLFGQGGGSTLTRRQARREREDTGQ